MSELISMRNIGKEMAKKLMSVGVTILNFNWKWFQKLYGWMYVIIRKQMEPHIADGSWNNT